RDWKTFSWKWAQRRLPAKPNQSYRRRTTFRSSWRRLRNTGSRSGYRLHKLDDLSMSEPTFARHNLVMYLSHALRLPAQRGWAVPAARWLAVWYVGNLGWIVGGLVTAIYLADYRPPPGWGYWLVWCVGGTVLSAGLALTAARLPIKKHQSWLWYGLLSL